MASQAPTLDQVYQVHKEFKKIVEILDKPITEAGGNIDIGIDEIRIFVPLGKAILSVTPEGVIARIGKTISINHDNTNGSLDVRVLGDNEEVTITVTSGVIVKVVVWVDTILLTLKLANVGVGTRVIINRFGKENPG